MDPAQTADLLAAHFPELADELRTPTRQANVHKQLACFAAYTHAAAMAHELPCLQRCFAVANGLLQVGDAGLAAAVMTGYLHCLHLDGTAHNNQLVRQFMPSGLYSAYTHLQHAMLP